jgi:hypothetical protein
MKKIVLLGDSIRLGYEKFIKDSLEGVAEVYSPAVNNKFTINLMRYLHGYVGPDGLPSDADLVHWNAGLWDVINMVGDDLPLTPPDAYADLIKRINKRIHWCFPKAKIVFATSTAVVEEGYTGTVRRFNKDIENYNKIALDALNGTDTVINDLYSITKDIPSECRSDMTHFNTEQGVKTLGGRVLAVICKELGIKQEDLKDASCIPPEIAKDILGF